MEFKGFKQGNQYNPVCLLNVGKNNMSYLAISSMRVASCLPPVITINPPTLEKRSSSLYKYTVADSRGGAPLVNR